MMYDQNLPLSLWAEATSTAVYIQNKCPHKALEEKTLEEVFTGKKPSVDHLRILVVLSTFMYQKKRGLS
jgi:hypothetical protein